jgi:hypothetical protein
MVLAQSHQGARRDHASHQGPVREAEADVLTILPVRVVLTILCVASLSAAAQRPELRVARSSAVVRLDGRLIEPAWASADSVANLTQVEPREGQPPVARTVVRVIATADALIIGIRADDPDAARITTFARERDANLTNEDHLRIVLDTYMDGRSGYVFIVNPNGARFDALVTNQGESEDANWDVPWEAATSRDERGWSVEIRLPAKSLLFKPGLTSWGFNVQRRVQRLQETSRWASPDQDVKVNMTSRAGTLVEIPSFDLGIGLSVRPASTASVGKPASGVDARADNHPSLDVTQRIGANTLAAVTVNTDFAETDVDTRRTNLTRFPLVFPEKRTFFLEGSDIFAFGLGTGDDLRAFFSRRIGLLQGVEVPIDLGVKVSGRQGGTSFGALAVTTGDVDTLPTGGNTMGVVRVRQNILGESSVGVIAATGDPVGRADSKLGGADLTYQTSRLWGEKNFLVGVWGMATTRADLSGDRRAFGGKIDYPNDLWDIAVTYKWLGDAFDPSTGFVPRRGVQILNVNVVHQPRPKRRVLGLRVRQMFNESLNTLVTDLDGRWQSWRIFTAPVNWRLESGDRMEFNFVPTADRIATPFAISGVTVPAGEYHWTRWRLEAGFASKRKVSGQLSWWFGDFYGGHLNEYIATASWKPSALFVMEMNATRNVGSLPNGDFTQQVVGTRYRINVSPDLQVSSYVQYDKESGALGANTRLRWTFAPQGELFVVYNHNAVDPLDPLGQRIGWRFASNQLLVKAQYAFRY